MIRTLSVLLILVLALYWYATTGVYCQAPLSYQLEPVDERFLIKTADAEAGRELFYPVSENADIVIRFVFDERQERAIAEASLRDSLDDKEETSSSITETYEALVDEYQSLQTKQDAAVRMYENKLYEHNATVERYNNAGGAPEEVFATLAAAEAALAKEAATLDQMNEELARLSRTINEVSERGNRLIEQYNANVQDYNVQFGEPDEFTQGDYTAGMIHIYTFTSQTELLQVLTHELGHALDLPHVEGSDSIMYYLLEDQPVPVQLSTADVAAFTATCGSATNVETTIRTFINRYI
jgi:Matrixin